MKQGLFDKIWNGVPEGGPKTIERPPIRFLRDYDPASVPAPRTPPPPREAVVLSSSQVEPQSPRHGGLVLSVVLIALISAFTIGFFAGDPAGASGSDDETVYINLPTDRQSGDKGSSSGSSSDDDFQELNLNGGTQCPAQGAPVTAYLADVQTDSDCLKYYPKMRK